jgi:hypothetical protein
MISHQEMLGIVCTEAIEYGGLQELPSQKHGAKQSFHSAKRGTRATSVVNGRSPICDSQPIEYDLRLIATPDGKLEWKD